MKTLNYSKLVALEPTVYDTFKNQLGQTVELVEHPLKGDEYPVIALIREYKVAVDTDFFDTEDMISINGELTDYTPVYMYGKVACAWEFDL